MKTIDLIGMFSNADLKQEKNPFPVLFKLIASVLDDYEINRIFLLYGAGNAENAERDFQDNWDSILQQLKTYFPDKCSKIEGLRDRVEIQYPDFNDVSVAVYYSKFRDILKKSKSDVIYFNFQSGNIQSKEALQILYETLSAGKEKLYYSESIENKSSNSHTTDVDAAELSKYAKELSGNEQRLDDVIKRVSIKDTKEMSLIFHKNIIIKFLEDKQYFNAYYHYLNHKTLFENNSATFILQNCFSDEINKLYFYGSILKKDVSKYLLFRLIYLKAKDEAGFLDTKISYCVCDKLLWVFRNLEDSSLSCDHGDTYIIERNRNSDNPSKFTSVEMIDDSLLENFNKKYNSLRHPRDVRFSEARFSSGDFSKLLSMLIKKFELKFINYLPAEYKGSDFRGCFDKTMQRCKSNINTQLEDKICFNLKSDKICFLSMFGSTDPAKSRTDILYPGSNLSFFKSISEEANLPDDKKELIDLRNKRKRIKIPYYCILSNEIINLLFSSNINYDVETLKEIYQFDDIYFLPFERMNGGSVPDVRKIIKDEKRFSIEELKSGKSLKYDDNGYDYKVCGEYIANTIHGLLDKYDIIYIIETSGIPNCKMALTFLSLCYPERIRVVEVKDPSPNQKKDIEQKKDIKVEKTQFKAVSPKKSDSLLNVVEKDDVRKTIGTLYLLQDATIEDFKKNDLILSDNLQVKMNKLDNEDYSNENKEVARRLVRVYYLLQNQMLLNVLIELDYCFETILGKRLKLRVDCDDKSPQIDPSCPVYKRYCECIEIKREKGEGFIEYNSVNSYIRMINYVLENIKEPATQRKYYDSALRLYRIWELVSHIKHPKDLDKDRQEAKEIKMTSNDIDRLLMFDISNGKKIESEYKTLKDEYESVRNDLDIRFWH